MKTEREERTMDNRQEVLRYFEAYREETDARVQRGIEVNRKGYGYITLKDSAGNPVVGATIRLKQKNHAFRFGANLFMLDEFETEEKNNIYKESFAKLFNMATLPFYWDSTEPEKGKHRYDKDSPKLYRRPAIDFCMEYCEEHGIEPREHALAYDHFFPDWLVGADVNTCKKELERRYREISERYADKIPNIEVTNEMQWEKGKTALYRSDDFMDWAFRKAEEYFPYNHLTINEGTSQTYVNFYENMSLYYLQIERLLKAGRRVDAVGIQFHMTSERGREWERGRFCYNPRHLYKVLDRYSDFGLPLQVTEITIPAYSLDPQDENIQADLAERLYSLWFSHPNMEQIIYWNLPDGYAFAAEPGDMTAGENQRFGGLLRFDMSKKPIYDRLDELINHRWRTDVSVTTDGQGKACFNGFYGDYEAIIDGKTYLLQLKKDADRNYEVKL